MASTVPKSTVLLLQAQQNDQQETHTHTRDQRQRQTKHCRSQHGKPRTTVSANPHLPKEDTRNRANSQVPELCHTTH